VKGTARLLFCCTSIFIVLITACTADKDKGPPVPELEGEWWKLTTHQPDISPYEYGDGDNQVCDFTIFQAENGKWQLIACVRGNNYPGSHRFLYRWEADSITGVLWEEKEVFMTTGTDIKADGFGKIRDTAYYPRKGLLQAPHCIIYNDQYYLFYNNRAAMCMISDDGVNWKEALNDNTSPHFFEMGRDLMIIDDRERSGNWIAYYTSGSDFPQYMAARTCSSLTGEWSDEIMVYDGWSNTRNPIYRNEFAESPFVLYLDGMYYLFAQMHVFISEDPLDFTENRKIANLESSHYDERVWAPEIIIDSSGQYYLAAYRPKGIFMTRMKFKDQ
jgi:hypothetical protein